MTCDEDYQEFKRTRRLGVKPKFPAWQGGDPNDPGVAGQVAVLGMVKAIVVAKVTDAESQGRTPYVYWEEQWIKSLEATIKRMRDEVLPAQPTGRINQQVNGYAA